MNTYDIEFVKLLPHFMREDAAIKGLARGTDEIIGDAPGKRHREVDTPSNGYSHSKAYSICVIPRYD